MVRRPTNPKPVSNMRRFLPSARQENAAFMRFARLDHLGRIQVIDSQCMIAVVSEGKQLVGERGFEPPTPWSRTRCSTRLSHSPTALRAATRKTIHSARCLQALQL